MKNASQLLDMARIKGITIATAESCTGGKISAELTEIPGSSDVFLCGYVTYSNAAKQAMLGVAAATLDAHGAVSEPVAREMAEGALARSGAGAAVSVTGIAGPGGSEHKPEGRVCFGLAVKGGPTHSETVEFGAPGRAVVRDQSTAYAIKLMRKALS
jgi:nicotinamide-nucleotide amidase